ncbi:Gfo/Idh/MocA family oxidoreductase [Microbacterium sp. ET2]|uniref:Gfo/Idh/MocA family protein n=1 Tax=Microbacterium albipurpureum TaxID=3050384 RepID=UPI00259CBB35|nr:Gfo/Idh/MocA family oxidoreductase [Microbacterium sp. ET2 (Ac-2212)]WJL96910.1 Gfo/Idh/MocA family oxidoreductase [Microbacterium sp. ET2 (Ac-2212)]
MTGRLRIGLVGTGWVAHQHVAGSRHVAADDVEIVAAADPRGDVLDDFATRYDIPHRFRDATTMITSGTVDAIALLTPPAVRAEVLEPAFAQGIHVLIEKPFAQSGADAVTFTEAAEAAHVTLAVSQNFRWFPEYPWVRAQVRRPEAGDVTFLEARTFQDRPQAGGVWRAEETKLEMAIFSVHLIDRLRWIAPTEPVGVRALTRRRRGSTVRGEQWASLLVDFAGGGVGVVTSSWTSRRLPTNTFRVDTTHGSVAVQRSAPMAGTATGVADFDGETPQEVVFSETRSGEHSALSYGSSMREFARAIAEGRDPAHSARDNLQTMGLMEAAYLSAARNGSPVTIEEALHGHVALR